MAKVVHAYKRTWNEAAGFSPYYLVYGLSPQLPVDHLPSQEVQWQSQIKKTYDIAFSNRSNVLLRNLTERDRPGKLDLTLGGCSICGANLKEP